MNQSNSTPFVSDLYSAIICHIDKARTELVTVIQLLRESGKIEDLQKVEKYLKGLADEMRKGNRAGGFTISLVDAKTAAGVMGRVTSTKKLEQLALAREKLAKNRKLEGTLKRLHSRRN